MNIRILTILALGILIMASAALSYAADAKKLYTHYCAQCHGPKGDGKGVNSQYLSVEPRNHTDPKEMGKLKDKDMFDAVKSGGESVGKSSAMPVWGKTLSDEEINALVKHMRQLCKCTGPG